MAKINYHLFIYLVLCFPEFSAAAKSVIIEKYAWTNRLVILVTDKKDTSLERQVKGFFENHACDINDRNLKLLHFHTDKIAVNHLPRTIRSKTGIWLLGYDGSIKDFSENGQLLERLFQTIDSMPMRQNEMSPEPACG